MQNKGKQVVKSIRKARERGSSDELILEEIRKQNPEKEVFFQKAIDGGASAKEILDEVIKQNTAQETLPQEESSAAQNTSQSSPLERIKYFLPICLLFVTTGIR